MSLDQAFFLVIALVGALFLFISFILGSVGDFFDDFGGAIGEHVDIPGLDGGADGAADGAGDEGPSPLSLRNLMAFLTAYGASGLITSSYGWSTLASSLFAVIPGLALAFVAFKFMQMLYGQQSSSVVEVSGLVGRVGLVDLAIPAAGLGRVTVSTGSGQSTFIARSEGGAAISQGERVVVKAALGSDLIVAPALSPAETPERA
jgi:membrane protein implicated in regulation of membrane protease activity